MARGVELVLVKLGGSLITHKGRDRKARPGVIGRLAREVAAATAGGRVRVILGHGSGSFGHRAAARAGVQHGLRSARQRSGASATQQVAHELHALVVAALRRAGCDPWSLAPSSFLLGKDGRADELFLDPLLAALEAGFTPVVYGDVVQDRSLGVSICSTEEVLSGMARKLRRRRRRPARALWLGDTEGVYDDARRLVPMLDAKLWKRLEAHVGGAAATDVTGGMRLRVETALTMAGLGIESWILDGRKRDALRRAILGQRVRATRVPAASKR